MKFKTGTIAALAAFFAAAFAQGGAQCRLQGTVTDSAGNPVDGASVTITTPNLRTFKMSLKSDKRGDWGTILNDATMPYHVRIEKDGFAPAESDKKVPVGDVGVVDAKLLTTAEAGAAASGHGAPAPPSPSDLAAISFNEGVDLLSAGNKPGAEAKFLEAVGK